MAPIASITYKVVGSGWAGGLFIEFGGGLPIVLQFWVVGFFLDGVLVTVVGPGLGCDHGG